MGLSGCYAVMKYLVFFLNFIFLVSGLLIVVLSAWMLSDPTFYVSLAQDESSYYSGIYLLLGIGILLFIVGFLGCCGTLKESQVMLVLFFCVLLLILVAEISTAAWAYTNSDKLELLVRESVRTTVREEYGIVQSRTQTFDNIQRGLSCCGADGPGDWAQSYYAVRPKNSKDKSKLSLVISETSTEFHLPPSCCVPDASSTECKDAATLPAIASPISPLIYAQGCSIKLIEVLQEYAKTFIGIGVAIGLAQILGLIFALILCCTLQRDSYKGSSWLVRPQQSLLYPIT